MRRFLSVAILVAAFLAPGRPAAAGVTVGTMSVTAGVVASCVVVAQGEAPTVRCTKGTSVVLLSSSLSLADMRTLIAAANVPPGGLGPPSGTWTLLSVYL